MNRIAIIPARSGSKGLNNKNIKLLNGKPLLAYSIYAAIDSGIFDCVHVSTDSEKYANIAMEYGADVPFLRSSVNSTDDAGTWETVCEVIEKYGEMGREFEEIVLLQPTSPLRDKDDIIEAYKLFENKKAKAVVSVCEMEHSPLWSNTLREDLSMDSFISTDESTARQNLPTYYRINGAIYIVNKNFLYANRNIYREGCFAYVMDLKKSIDIDRDIDFYMAEFILKNEY